MDSTWEEIKNQAKEKTNDTFASKISSLTHLTDDEIKKIAPNTDDKINLANLLEIVADTTKSNDEKAKAVKSIKGLAEIAIPLLMKLL